MRIRRREFMQWMGTAIALGTTRRWASASPVRVGSKAEGDLDRLPILDQVQPITSAEHRERIQAVQRRMKALEFGALLLEPGTNLQYFTGVRFGRSERLVCVVIPGEGEPFFVVPAFEAELFRGQVTVPEVVTWEEHENPYARVFQTLRRTGPQSGVLGLGPTTRMFVYQGLKDTGEGFTVKIGSGLVDPLRTRKSAHELELMRAAIAVTEEAIRQTWKRVREGMTERELAAELRRVFQELGSPGGGLVQFAAASALPHGRPGDRKLQEGDVVLIDCGTRVHGYASDVTRTGVFRKAPAKVAEVWQVVRDAQAAAIDKARPGVPCEELDIAARSVIEKAGYGKYFVHRLGHGLGMDGHEHPYLVRGNRTPLEPGNTVTIEPGIYLPGEFGVRIEDDVVITEEGCRPLSQLVDKLEVI